MFSSHSSAQHPKWSRRTRNTWGFHQFHLFPFGKDTRSHIAFKALPDIAKHQQLSALLPWQRWLIMQQKIFILVLTFTSLACIIFCSYYSNASKVSAHSKYIIPFCHVHCPGSNTTSLDMWKHFNVSIYLAILWPQLPFLDLLCQRWGVHVTKRAGFPRT